MESLGCSFTGHRRIEKEHALLLDGMLDRAIAYAYGQGCRRFYCGGAIGFDTAAAKRVMLFKLSHPDCELHLLIPCKNQSEKWTDGQVRMYNYLLGAADTVTYLADEYTPDCMRRRNARLVELADMVIAYLCREYSGAGQTVRMAKSAGKTVYNLYHTLDAESKEKER